MALESLANLAATLLADADELVLSTSSLSKKKRAVLKESQDGAAAETPRKKRQRRIRAPAVKSETIPSSVSSYVQGWENVMTEASPDSEDPNAARLLSVLSSNMRHWCMYEFFYSTLDRDYFNENEFRACLRVMGLDHVKRLTRTEWSAVRSTMTSELGKPRRLSPAYLQNGRKRLQQYRKQVREIQQRVKEPPSPRTFPYQVFAPIAVGDCISAYHKKARLIHRGYALTVHESNPDRTLYRVQFERPELGTEICSDVQIAAHGIPDTIVHRKRPEDVDDSDPLDDLQHAYFDSSMGNGKQQVLVSLTKLLDRKETLLSALKTLNDRAEMALNRWTECHPKAERPPFHHNFQSQYAWVAHNIDVTNRALRPAVQQLQYMLESQDMSTHRRTMDIKPSADTKRLLQFLWEDKMNAARQLIHSLPPAEYPEGSVSSEESAEADEMLVKCIAVLNVVRHCAEGRLGVIELALAMQMTKDKLTPSPESNTNNRLHTEISMLLEMIEGYLTMHFSAAHLTHAADETEVDAEEADNKLYA